MTNTHDIDFWLRLRTESGFEEFMQQRNRPGGQYNCNMWTGFARNYFQRAGIEPYQQMMVEQTDPAMEDLFASLDVRYHTWLQDGTYVADGTAGQFDPGYARGFYGQIDESPPSLREMYQHGKPFVHAPIVPSPDWTEFPASSREL